MAIPFLADSGSDDQYQHLTLIGRVDNAIALANGAHAAKVLQLAV
jgi:hypothetical protein